MFGIIFLLIYAKWKYERSKEELEKELKENKDNRGNDIKKAGLTNVYKYSKQSDENNNADYLVNESGPTPQPTIGNVFPQQFFMSPPVIPPQSIVQRVQTPPVQTVVVRKKQPTKIVIRRDANDHSDDDIDSHQPQVIAVQAEPTKRSPS